MLSTLRLLRCRHILTVNLVTKAATSGIHCCVSIKGPYMVDSVLWKKKVLPSTLPLTSVNWMSTGGQLKSADLNEPKSEISTETVPDPPLPDTQSVLNDATNNLHVAHRDIIPPPPSTCEPNGEATFESLGLGGWSPVGLIENGMEFLHINLDIPWWGAIVIGTICVRSLLFPLVIQSQRNAARMNNNLPAMQAIQLKMSEARERGDRIDSARYAQELMVFMNQKQLNPLKNMLVPLAQAPIFVSFFMALRGMASLPVESLKEGGLFWFVDLTVPDQFYLLPIMTCLTLLVTVEVGTDTARLSSSNLGVMKYALRALPVCIFPFTLGFPAAILVYWTSSNFISLLQVSILKIPRVRNYFKIEQLIKHDTNELPIQDKGFVKGVKESWSNIKITRELEDRERADEMKFMQAGRGSVRKTYKYDPTQKRPPRSIGAIELKKRE